MCAEDFRAQSKMINQFKIKINSGKMREIFRFTLAHSQHSQNEQKMISVSCAPFIHSFIV